MKTVELLRSIFENAMKDYNLLKEAKQKDCPHLLIYLDCGNYGSRPQHPRRRCSECGLTEVGGWWQIQVTSVWTDVNHQNPGVLTENKRRIVVEVEQSDFDKAGCP